MRIESFNTRRAALEAEQIAIWTERPRYNTTYNIARRCEKGREEFRLPNCIHRRVASNGCWVYRVHIRRKVNGACVSSYSRQFETLAEARAAVDDYEQSVGKYKRYERKCRKPRSSYRSSRRIVDESEKRALIREHAAMLLGE
jgi:hypothetical protein